MNNLFNSKKTAAVLFEPERRGVVGVFDFLLIWFFHNGHDTNEQLLALSKRKISVRAKKGFGMPLFLKGSLPLANVNLPPGPWPNSTWDLFAQWCTFQYHHQNVLLLATLSKTSGWNLKTVAMKKNTDSWLGNHFSVPATSFLEVQISKKYPNKRWTIYWPPSPNLSTFWACGPSK